MSAVVFVAPFFLETTLRFVEAVADLPGVRTGLVSQDPAERLPPGLEAEARRACRGSPTVSIRSRSPTRCAPGAPDRPAAASASALSSSCRCRWARCATRSGIEGMGAEVAKNFRDKARMKTVLQRAGVPCARHRRVTERRRRLELRRAASAIRWWSSRRPAPAPRAPSGSTDADELRRGARRAAVRLRERPAVIEEFVTGEEFSFDTVTIHGRPVWHSLSHYLPTPLARRRQPVDPVVRAHSPRDRPSALRRHPRGRLPGAGECSAWAPASPTWSGSAPDGSVLVSEVGARPPGAQITSLISYAHDIDFYRAWARLVVFDEFDAAGPPVRRRRRLPARSGARAASGRSTASTAVLARPRAPGRRSEAARRSAQAQLVELRGRRLRHRPSPGDRGRGTGVCARSSTRASGARMNLQRADALAGLPGRDALFHPRPVAGRGARDRPRRPADGGAAGDRPRPRRASPAGALALGRELPSSGRSAAGPARSASTASSASGSPDMILAATPPRGARAARHDGRADAARSATRRS